MLAQNTTAHQSFAILSESIEESFLSIDRFEFQVAEELRVMRDDRVFEEGGYKSFEEYCDRCLFRWGGYRRVNQLIGAQMVVDTLKGTEFDGVIKRESHARPLLRLVKTPEKLKEAVAIALHHNPEPIADNFKEAAATVVPMLRRTKSQEQLFLNGDKVRINSRNHYRFNQEGEISGNPENGRQMFVTFAHGEKELISIDEIGRVESLQYTPKPRTYTEEELQAEIARAIEESKIGDRAKAREDAESSVQEQLKAARELLNQKAVEAAKLRQEIEGLQSLRLLEAENRRLEQRIHDLEDSIEPRACQQWGNTFTKGAEKVINTQVLKAVENLEPELHLRLMSNSAPSENPRGTISLLGLSLAAMANGHPRFAKELRKAAAIVLGVDELKLDAKSQQLRQLGEAIASIKSVLALPDADWATFSEIGDRFDLIKQEIWLELTSDEREQISQLSAEFYAVGRVAWSESLGKKIKIEQVNVDKTASVYVVESNEVKVLPFADIKPVQDIDFPELPVIQIGSRVSGSDHFHELYLKTGTVTGFENDMVLVHWDHCDRPLFQHRYEEGELRLCSN
ncbi:hypothetical protein H6G36_25435 [Anabaena minutissima FACHB-250]|nr:hypothetical protein [Anabaena minutissima FACHB-250]